jgi:hypothetical protein
MEDYNEYKWQQLNPSLKTVLLNAEVEDDVYNVLVQHYYVSETNTCVCQQGVVASDMRDVERWAEHVRGLL